MRRALLLLSSVALLACPARLRAQNIPSPYQYIEKAQSFGVYTGYLFTGSGDRDIGPKSAPVIGARYVGRFAGPAAAVVSMSFMPSSRDVYARTDVTNPTASLVRLGEADAQMFIVQAGLRFGITGPRTWHGFAPSLTAKAGLISDLASRSSVEAPLPQDQLVDFGPSFALGVSAGTDWFLSRTLSVDLGVEDQIWRLSTPEGLSPSGKGESDWTQNIGITIGAAFHF